MTQPQSEAQGLGVLESHWSRPCWMPEEAGTWCPQDEAEEELRLLKQPRVCAGVSFSPLLSPSTPATHKQGRPSALGPPASLL